MGAETEGEEEAVRKRVGWGEEFVFLVRRRWVLGALLLSWETGQAHGAIELSRYVR